MILVSVLAHLHRKGAAYPSDLKAKVLKTALERNRGILEEEARLLLNDVLPISEKDESSPGARAEKIDCNP